MKAISLVAPHELVEVEIAEPHEPGPDEALVRTHCVGICGTDISSYLGKFPLVSYPRIPGHELGVEILAVGSRATNVRPGDRCSVEPYLQNSGSFASRRGATNCCENLQVLGVHVDGGLRDRFTLLADKLHVSQKLSFEQLALVEPLAIGCHAVDRAAPVKGEHLLLIGVGPIGLAVLEFALLAGAVVTVMDLSQSRLDFCRKHYQVANTMRYHDGASALDELRKITGGAFYPVVIDATGNAASMSRAIHFVAHTGTLVYVGITTQSISFPHRQMHLREATIKSSRNALPGDFRRIIRLIEDGAIDTEPWITHRTTFANLIDKFDSYTKPETGVVKAIVQLVQS